MMMMAAPLAHRPLPGPPPHARQRRARSSLTHGQKQPLLRRHPAKRGRGRQTPHARLAASRYVHPSPTDPLHWQVPFRTLTDAPRPSHAHPAHTLTGPARNTPPNAHVDAMRGDDGRAPAISRDLFTLRRREARGRGQKGGSGKFNAAQEPPRIRPA